MDTTEKILSAIEKLPGLTEHGIGTPINGEILGNRDIYPALFRLLDSTEQFEKLCTWMAGIDKQQNINKCYTSAYLSQFSARDLGPISNGLFIAAAIYRGFKFERVNYGPNAMFNMSDSSISKINARKKR